MHSSCAQVMLSRIAMSCTTGIVARNRSTTDAKITTVAMAISAPISVSSSRSSSLSASIALPGLRRNGGHGSRTLLHARGRLLLDQLVDHVLADATGDFSADRKQRLDPGGPL